MAMATGTMTKTTMTMNNDYQTRTSMMMLMTMTTSTRMTTMTTKMTTTKTTMAIMDNLPIIFYNIIMIIWAASRANHQKYHGLSQLHPLDNEALGVPTLLANGHTHGTIYVRTYLQTQYDGKPLR